MWVKNEIFNLIVKLLRPFVCFLSLNFLTFALSHRAEAPWGWMWRAIDILIKAFTDACA